MRPDDERYFAQIEDRLDEAWDVAEAAKEQGHDPKPKIEIPIARDMADRVENILGIDGVAERVRELEGEMSREEAALELVTDFVEGTVGDYDSRAGKVEGAVRTAVALLTEGSSPRRSRDRPGRAAGKRRRHRIRQRLLRRSDPVCGGTPQALSVLVADYARSLLDIDEYKPRDVEVERYAEEISLYDKETGLQYSPKDKESKFIAQHMPVMLDGEATGDGRSPGSAIWNASTPTPRAAGCVSWPPKDRAEGPEDPAVHPRPRRGRLAVAARSDRRNDRQGRRRRERRGSRECRRRGRRRQRGHRGQRERRGRRG